MIRNAGGVVTEDEFKRQIQQETGIKPPWERARESGAIQAEITPAELLALAAGLAWAAEHTAEPAGFVDKLLGITLIGLGTWTPPASR